MAAVQAKMPKQIKRKRRVVTEDGMDAGMEEYIDFVFADEGAPSVNLKLLEAAQRWKRQKAADAAA